MAILQGAQQAAASPTALQGDQPKVVSGMQGRARACSGSLENGVPQHGLLPPPTLRHRHSVGMGSQLCSRENAPGSKRSHFPLGWR